jgi:GH15 family glucan-1,4-alpha-glucosidase
MSNTLDDALAGNEGSFLLCTFWLAQALELLGNFPQAFSHIGLVNAAWAISEAER